MKPIIVFIIAVILGTLTSCNTQNSPSQVESVASPTPTAHPLQSTLTITPNPEPLRVLTICSQEPASLFLLRDGTSAARSILQAIYDGPIDLLNFDVQPVILEQIPSVQNGGARLEPVDVSPGELIADAQGNWITMAEGVLYKPSGCIDLSCALPYEGQDPVKMDALVLQFHLLPGIQWSDGLPLTAADSVFSFEVFSRLNQNTLPEMIRFTESYTALDDRTVEWKGVPGYVGSIPSKFISPLPAHQLDQFDTETLLTSALTNRTPIGWGPYIIDEWVDGDHITLNRNPNYFRAAEGLPHFDHLVYRFMSSGDEAIDALLVGECDFVDRTLLHDEHIDRLKQAQGAGNLTFVVQTGTAWELAAFGIDTLNLQRVDLFGNKQVRQAIAMCIDRQKIVDELLFGVSLVPDSYIPPNHPLFQSQTRLEFSPERAGELFTTAGWMDTDADPQTPRTAQGIPGIPDGTPFEFTYLVPSDAQRPKVAGIIKEGLAQCGIGVEVIPENWDGLMKPGPEGPLFGRQFEMAQFAWVASIEPACYLFSSDEIPGPYPAHPKGWGGGNLTGYSSLEFDEACRQAKSALPGSEIYIENHTRAQAIFMDELPVIPLYQHIGLVAMGPDLCHVVIDPATQSALSHLELLDYGDTCN